MKRAMKHCWLGHDWSSWCSQAATRDADFGTMLVVQAKNCHRCNKLKLRTVSA